MAQDRGDQVMAVGEHIRLDPDVLPDDALDGEPPGVDLGPQALHDHADGIGGAARLGGASALGARGGYDVTPGEVSDAMIGTGGWTLPRRCSGQPRPSSGDPSRMGQRAWRWATARVTRSVTAKSATDSPVAMIAMASAGGGASPPSRSISMGIV